MKTPFVIPFPILYRGFHPQTEPSAQELIIRHKRVSGLWVEGFYAYSQSDDTHWICSADDSTRVHVLPETVGLLEPTSGHWCGDTCYFQHEIRGVLRFGRHKDINDLNREEVSFYIEWQGKSITAAILRQDIIYWSRSKDVIWKGTMWDPKPPRKKKT